MKALVRHGGEKSGEKHIAKCLVRTAQHIPHTIQDFRGQTFASLRLSRNKMLLNTNLSYGSQL